MEQYMALKCLLLRLIIGITNPAVILTFIFAFSYFDLFGKMSVFQGVQLVCGVFIGTFIWWSTLSIGVNIVKNKARSLDMKKMNQVFGLILFLFGAVILI